MAKIGSDALRITFRKVAGEVSRIQPGLWLARLWKRRQQEIDRQILWPSLREQAGSLEQARAGFRAHMELDPAYSLMDPAERDAYVAGLPA